MTHRIRSFLAHSKHSHWPTLLAFVFALPCTTAAEELGRLFFTPERRQQLDHQRQFNIEERSEVPEDPTLTINGVVTRSSGKQTVWINGTPRNENDESAGIRVDPARSPPGTVLIRSGESVGPAIGVGSSINSDTGEASDLINGGSISIRRTK